MHVGLLSSHLIITSKELPLIQGKREYKNELLNLAFDLGSRLVRAFETPTGIPYGTVTKKKQEPNIKEKGEKTNRTKNRKKGEKRERKKKKDKKHNGKIEE